MTTRSDFISATAIAAGHQVIAFTECNAIGLCAWQLAEGSRAAWNPWDTTLYVKGATPYNTFDGDLHVWNYPNEEEGIYAFLATLFNGPYHQIRQALAVGTSAQALAVAVGETPWGTGNFSRLVQQVQADPSAYLGEALPNAR